MAIIFIDGYPFASACLPEPNLDDRRAVILRQLAEHHAAASPLTWEGSDEHKRVLHDAYARRDDVHAAVADHFGVTRQAAKLASFKLLYEVAEPKAIKLDVPARRAGKTLKLQLFGREGRGRTAAEKDAHLLFEDKTK